MPAAYDETCQVDTFSGSKCVSREMCDVTGMYMEGKVTGAVVIESQDVR
jgi:hypothetical protein